MKKLHILLLAALACGTARAETDNTFYFTDAVVAPGETTNIELCLKNSQADLTCLEAEIQLPEGLSVVCDEDGSPVTTLYRNRTPEHDILTNVLASGNFKLLVSSIDGKPIGDGNGPLLSFRVQASPMTSSGECTVETVGETLLVTTQAQPYYCIGVTGNVLVTDDPTSIEELRMKHEQSDASIYDLRCLHLRPQRTPNRKWQNVEWQIASRHQHHPHGRWHDNESAGEISNNQ